MKASNTIAVFKIVQIIFSLNLPWRILTDEPQTEKHQVYERKQYPIDQVNINKLKGKETEPNLHVSIHNLTSAFSDSLTTTHIKYICK